MMIRDAIPTRKTVRWALIAVMAATALSTVIILVTHRSGDMPAPGPETTNSATLSLDKMRHTASRQGVDEWSVDAETVHLYNTENRAVFNRLTARYFEKSGAVTILTADKGVLDTQTRNMEVTGHVVVKRDGLTVTSKALTYTRAAHTIASKTPVTISDGISTLSGDTMLLDLNADKLEMHGNVKGTLHEESERKADETLPR